MVVHYIIFVIGIENSYTLRRRNAKPKTITISVKAIIQFAIKLFDYIIVKKLKFHYVADSNTTSQFNWKNGSIIYRTISFGEN